jgi:hypothetical protein
MFSLLPGIGVGTVALLGLAGIAPLSADGQAAGPTAQDTADTAAFFEKKVRPLLYERCSACHGEKQQAGGLRLDTVGGLARGATSGAVVVAGDIEKSTLLRAIHYDAKIKMPPTGKLPTEEIATLTEWVRRGAVWPAAKPLPTGTPTLGSFTAAQRKFWAFQPVKRSTLPVVKNAAWVKNPIDTFLLARLEAKGLKPAPPADRRTLIRRATFDLTGLPPTPEEVQSFLVDRSPDAYAKLVDRLLSSPRYGERWGRHWLDVVRYADSADSRGLGTEGDFSEAWRYRDWVVDAFNRDLPYDRFVINQIAGDLLPPDAAPQSMRTQPAGASQSASTKLAGLEPVSAPGSLNIPGTIATGMLALGNWGNGDADKDKILTDIADDQVDVVSRGFMGLTVACARCHDHKFDPIATKDYYGLAGIFFSSHILPKLTPKGAGETFLRIPLETKADADRRAQYLTHTTELEARIKAEATAQYATYVRSMLPQTPRYLVAAWNYAHRPAGQAVRTLADFAQAQGLREIPLRNWLDYLGLNADYRLMTTPIRDALNTPGIYVWRGVPDCPNLTVNTTAQAHMLLTFTLPPKSVSVHPGPTDGVAVEWVSPIAGTVQVTGKATDADPACGNGIAWAVAHRQGTGTVELASGSFPNGGKQGFAEGKTPQNLNAIPVKRGDRLQLLVLPNGDYSCDTTTVEFVITQKDGAKENSHVWNLTADLIDEPLRANPRADRYGNAGVWRLADMAGSRRPTGAPSPAVAAWNAALTPAADPAAVEKAAQEFANAFKIVEASSPFVPASEAEESLLPAEGRAVLSGLRADLAMLRKNPPPPIAFANGAQEGGVPESPHAGVHDVKVHLRGRYDRLGDLVPRHFPTILTGEALPPKLQGSGRLELAQWIASPSHPLTGRVLVNRVWQHHFGEGIVRTPSNFGFLGERPTHPELLDWLASVFVAPVKADSPYACGWSLKRLHRLMMLSSAYRQSSDPLPSTLKTDPDNRLFGRMSRHRLEAEALRDNVLAVSGNLDTTLGGVATRDFNSGRRTLYLMTVRSDRSGFGPLFDAADSGVSVERRTVSTVAPQALFLLNSPFLLTQTRLLAQRLSKAEPQNGSARIRSLYQLLYSRAATAQEVEIGLAFLARAAQEKPKPDTLKSTTEGELRPWEEYCQLLLCANEFLYID